MYSQSRQNPMTTPRAALAVFMVIVCGWIGGSASAQNTEFDRLFLTVPFWVEGERVDTSATLTIEGRRLDRPWQEMSRERPFAATSSLIKFLRAVDAADRDAILDMSHPDYLVDPAIDYNRDITTYIETWSDVENPRVIAIFAFGDQVTFAVRAEFGDYSVVPLLPFRQTADGLWKFAPAHDTLTQVLLSNWSSHAMTLLSDGAKVDDLFAATPPPDTLYITPVEARPGIYNPPLIAFDGADPASPEGNARIAAAADFIAESQASLGDGDVEGFISQYTAESEEYLRSFIASEPDAEAEIVQFASAEPLFMIDFESVVGVYFLRNEELIDLVFLSNASGEFEYINASSVNVTSNAFLTPLMLQGAVAEPPFAALRLSE